MTRRHIIRDTTGRLELSADITDADGNSTSFAIASRTLTAWSWQNWPYHRGDRVTIEQQTNGHGWEFHGIVLYKRLNKLVLGEVAL